MREKIKHTHILNFNHLRKIGNIVLREHSVIDLRYLVVLKQKHLVVLKQKHLVELKLKHLVKYYARVSPRRKCQVEYASKQCCGSRLLSADLPWSEHLGLGELDLDCGNSFSARRRGPSLGFSVCVCDAR